jgi:hypothetical protein
VTERLALSSDGASRTHSPALPLARPLASKRALQKKDPARRVHTQRGLIDASAPSE